ncbi:LysM peptidoglycan-binding domain-containing protein [Hymenobacter sp. 5516J-16]|uniref:LysM peptidoglycan-binding domain-containing protein n=1 Tax=Hymenobacter sp. 5516J-16 TaxID=2932253 RepID=UPI001FD25B1E|nr:LysM peptidoglycan-binding domain-containing protein [Hymenobacter sp. 5516J-16]UOQ78268.1 LysM peptidoglycan-binding domain-containing protein [Hymenobacter sp. 5516J-16]
MPAPATKPTTTVPASAPVAPAVSGAPRPAAPAMPVPTVVEPIPASGQHVVQPKENLYSVARRFSLRPADIVAWNNLPPNPSLRIGQVLRLTAPAAENGAVAPSAPVSKPVPAASKPAATPAVAPAVAAPAAPASVRHTVLAGETMYSVSRKYGVTIKQIMEWNSKPDFSVKPGEVLVIKPAK